MIKLDFKGPFKYNDFLKTESDKANQPGIYILGFMDNDPEHWDRTSDFCSKPFIPYYVGKSESSIYKRVNEHYGTIHSAKNTYMILEQAVYNNLLCFLNKVKRNSQPYRSFPKLTSDIAYLNNPSFILKKYNHIVTKETSSDKIDQLNHNTGIKDIINTVFTPDNLYICFASLKEPTKNILEHAEAAVKFCIKSNTISTAEISFKKLKSSGILFDITCTNNRGHAECFFNIFHSQPYDSKNKRSKIEFDLNKNIYYGYLYHDFGPIYTD